MFKRLSHVIVDHWLAKIIAIVLALGLWAFVVNTGYRNAVFAEPIPVMARDVPDTLAVASDLPSIQVEVFAPTASFQRLKAGDIQAFVNAADLPAGSHSLEIKVFADDPNVRIVEVTPPFLELTLEQKKTDNFEVKLETEGNLGQGYVADAAELRPNEVEVTGAASVIDRVDQVVVRLPLNGETSDVARGIRPVALDDDRKEIANLGFDPAVVDIKLPVVQAEDAKSIGIEVETSGQPAEGFFVGTITTDPTTATAEGSSKALAKITTLSTEAVDLSGATERIERTVKLETPDNVRAEPASVKVTIEIRAGTLTRDLTAAVEIINVPADFEASLEPTSIRVTLSGPADKVRAAADSSPHVRIEAGSLGEGEHAVQLSRGMLGLDSSVEVQFVPGSVTVTLSKR
ncbi:MAG: CdaR family protein [Parcubacteria group bacterium]